MSYPDFSEFLSPSGISNNSGIFSLSYGRYFGGSIGMPQMSVKSQRRGSSGGESIGELLRGCSLSNLFPT
jgi:hypothetical protein